MTNLPARGWLAHETLAARRADLIMLTILGTRTGAPQVDYTVNAGVGFPLISGPEGHEGPVNQVIPAWDIATGMMAATGILAAERHRRSEEHTSELQSLMRISYAVFCLKNKIQCYMKRRE